MLLLFMDSEGVPIQEITGFIVDSTTFVIVSVYHDYAYCSPSTDTYSRNHIHGLCPKVLQITGFLNESALLYDFLQWLSTHDVGEVIANDPRKEKMLVPHLPTVDAQLPGWSERAELRCYNIALMYKKLNYGICDVFCGPEPHSSFVSPHQSRSKNPTVKDLLFQQHGYHCSLYDTLMIYIYWKDLRPATEVAC